MGRPSKEAQARHRAKVRAETGVSPSRKSLLKKFGFTPASFAERAKNGCDICGGQNPDGSALILDHDHTTGEFRGVLCRQHNAAIGLMGDTVADAARAMGYLLFSEVNRGC